MRQDCLGGLYLKHLAPLRNVIREMLKYFKVSDGCQEFTESLTTTGDYRISNMVPLCTEGLARRCSNFGSGM